MPIKKNAGRQELIVAYVDIAAADPGYAAAEDVLDLPGNAVIVGGDVTVIEAWGAAATLKLGDALDDDRYTTAAVNLAALGRTALAVTGHVHPVAQSLKALVTGAAGAQGLARVCVQYYVKGRSAFTQG